MPTPGSTLAMALRWPTRHPSGPAPSPSFARESARATASGMLRGGERVRGGHRGGGVGGGGGWGEVHGVVVRRPDLTLMVRLVRKNAKLLVADAANGFSSVFFFLPLSLHKIARWYLATTSLPRSHCAFATTVTFPARPHLFLSPGGGSKWPCPSFKSGTSYELYVTARWPLRMGRVVSKQYRCDKCVSSVRATASSLCLLCLLMSRAHPHRHVQKSYPWTIELPVWARTLCGTVSLPPVGTAAGWGTWGRTGAPNVRFGMTLSCTAFSRYQLLTCGVGGDRVPFCNPNVPNARGRAISRHARVRRGTPGVYIF